jgi:hypothetical protein
MDRLISSKKGGSIVRKTFFFLFAAVACLFAVAHPARAAAAGPVPVPKVAASSAAMDVGIIFSSSNLLLDLDTYQGGLGIKFGSGDLYFRGAFDVMLSSAAGSFSADAGVTVEYHLLPAPLSPYVGGYANIGYAAQENVLWTLPCSIVAVAGVEVTFFDFISVFAEYCLNFDLTVTTSIPTSQTSFTYLLDTNLGNGPKLGIVVYLTRAARK